MTHQQAVSVVAAPLALVERTVRRIEEWPKFLDGVEEVTRTSFGRYRFVVRDGSSTRTGSVAVTEHPGEHRVMWRSVAGPRFEGEIKLSPADAGHTRVSLTLTSDPAGFLAGLADLVRTHGASAVIDLQRLEATVLEAPA